MFEQIHNALGTLTDITEEMQSIHSLVQIPVFKLTKKEMENKGIPREDFR